MEVPILMGMISISSLGASVGKRSFTTEVTEKPEVKP